MKPITLRIEQLALDNRSLEQLTSLLKKRQRKYSKRPPEARRRLLRQEIDHIKQAIASRGLPPQADVQSKLNKESK